MTDPYDGHEVKTEKLTKDCGYDTGQGRPKGDAEVAGTPGSIAHDIIDDVVDGVFKNVNGEAGAVSPRRPGARREVKRRSASSSPARPPLEPHLLDTSEPAPATFDNDHDSKNVAVRPASSSTADVSVGVSNCDMDMLYLIVQGLCNAKHVADGVQVTQPLPPSPPPLETAVTRAVRFIGEECRAGQTMPQDDLEAGPSTGRRRFPVATQTVGDVNMASVLSESQLEKTSAVVNYDEISARSAGSATPEAVAWELMQEALSAAFKCAEQAKTAAARPGPLRHSDKGAVLNQPPTQVASQSASAAESAMGEVLERVFEVVECAGVVGAPLRRTRSALDVRFPDALLTEAPPECDEEKEESELQVIECDSVDEEEVSVRLVAPWPPCRRRRSDEPLDVLYPPETLDSDSESLDVSEHGTTSMPCVTDERLLCTKDFVKVSCRRYLDGVRSTRVVEEEVVRVQSAESPSREGKREQPVRAHALTVPAARSPHSRTCSPPTLGAFPSLPPFPPSPKSRRAITTQPGEQMVVPHFDPSMYEGESVMQLNPNPPLRGVDTQPLPKIFTTYPEDIERCVAVGNTGDQLFSIPVVPYFYLKEAVEDPMPLIAKCVKQASAAPLSDGEGTGGGGVGGGTGGGAPPKTDIPQNQRAGRESAPAAGSSAGREETSGLRCNLDVGCGGTGSCGGCGGCGGGGAVALCESKSANETGDIQPKPTKTSFSDTEAVAKDVRAWLSALVDQKIIERQEQMMHQEILVCNAICEPIKPLKEVAGKDGKNAEAAEQKEGGDMSERSPDGPSGATRVSQNGSFISRNSDESGHVFMQEEMDLEELDDYPDEDDESGLHAYFDQLLEGRVNGATLASKQDAVRAILEEYIAQHIAGGAVHGFFDFYRERSDPECAYGILASAAADVDEWVREYVKGKMAVGHQSHVDTHGTAEPHPPEPKAMTGTEPKAMTGTEPKAMTGTEPKAMTGTEPKAMTGTEPKAMTGTEPKAMTGTEPKAMTDMEPKAMTDMGPKTITDTKPKALTDMKTKASTMPSLKRKIEPQSRHSSRPKIPRNSEPKANRNSDSTTKKSAGPKGKKNEEPKANKVVKQKAKKDARLKTKKTDAKLNMKSESVVKKNAESKSTRTVDPHVVAFVGQKVKESKAERETAVKKEGEPKVKKDGEPKVKKDGEPKVKKDGEPKERKDGETKVNNKAESQMTKKAEPKIKKLAEPSIRKGAESMNKTDKEPKVNTQAESKVSRNLETFIKHNAEVKGKKVKETSMKKNAEQKFGCTASHLPMFAGPKGYIVQSRFTADLQTKDVESKEPLDTKRTEKPAHATNKGSETDTIVDAATPKAPKTPSVHIWLTNFIEDCLKHRMDAEEHSHQTKEQTTKSNKEHGKEELQTWLRSLVFEEMSEVLDRIHIAKQRETPNSNQWLRDYLFQNVFERIQEREKAERPEESGLESWLTDYIFRNIVVGIEEREEARIRERSDLRSWFANYIFKSFDEAVTEREEDRNREFESWLKESILDRYEKHILKKDQKTAQEASELGSWLQECIFPNADEHPREKEETSARERPNSATSDNIDFISWLGSYLLERTYQVTERKEIGLRAEERLACRSRKEGYSFQKTDEAINKHEATKAFQEEAACMPEENSIEEALGRMDELSFLERRERPSKHDIVLWLKEYLLNEVLEECAEEEETKVKAVIDSRTQDLIRVQFSPNGCLSSNVNGDIDGIGDREKKLSALRLWLRNYILEKIDEKLDKEGIDRTTEVLDLRFRLNNSIYSEVRETFSLENISKAIDFSNLKQCIEVYVVEKIEQEFIHSTHLIGSATGMTHPRESKRLTMQREAQNISAYNEEGNKKDMVKKAAEDIGKSNLQRKGMLEVKNHVEENYREKLEAPENVNTPENVGYGNAASLVEETRAKEKREVTERAAYAAERRRVLTWVGGLIDTLIEEITLKHSVSPVEHTSIPESKDEEEEQSKDRNDDRSPLKGKSKKSQKDPKDLKGSKNSKDPFPEAYTVKSVVQGFFDDWRRQRRLKVSDSQKIENNEEDVDVLGLCAGEIPKAREDEETGKNGKELSFESLELTRSGGEILEGSERQKKSTEDAGLILRKMREFSIEDEVLAHGRATEEISETQAREDEGSKAEETTASTTDDNTMSPETNDFSVIVAPRYIDQSEHDLDPSAMLLQDEQSDVFSDNAANNSSTTAYETVIGMQDQSLGQERVDSIFPRGWHLNENSLFGVNSNSSSLDWQWSMAGMNMWEENSEHAHCHCRMPLNSSSAQTDSPNGANEEPADHLSTLERWINQYILSRGGRKGSAAAKAAAARANAEKAAAAKGTQESLKGAQAHEVTVALQRAKSALTSDDDDEPRQYMQEEIDESAFEQSDEEEDEDKMHSYFIEIVQKDIHQGALRVEEDAEELRGWLERYLDEKMDARLQELEKNREAAAAAVTLASDRPLSLPPDQFTCLDLEAQPVLHAPTSVERFLKAATREGLTESESQGSRFELRLNASWRHRPQCPFEERCHGNEFHQSPSTIDDVERKKTPPNSATECDETEERTLPIERGYKRSEVQQPHQHVQPVDLDSIKTPSWGSLLQSSEKEDLEEAVTLSPSATRYSPGKNQQSLSAQEIQLKELQEGCKVSEEENMREVSSSEGANVLLRNEMNAQEECTEHSQMVGTDNTENGRTAEAQREETGSRRRWDGRQFITSSHGVTWRADLEHCLEMFVEAKVRQVTQNVSGHGREAMPTPLGSKSTDSMVRDVVSTVREDLPRKALDLKRRAREELRSWLRVYVEERLYEKLGRVLTQCYSQTLSSGSTTPSAGSSISGRSQTSSLSSSEEERPSAEICVPPSDISLQSNVYNIHSHTSYEYEFERALQLHPAPPDPEPIPSTSKQPVQVHHTPLDPEPKPSTSKQSIPILPPTSITTLGGIKSSDIILAYQQRARSKLKDMVARDVISVYEEVLGTKLKEKLTKEMEIVFQPRENPLQTQPDSTITMCSSTGTNVSVEMAIHAPEPPTLRDIEEICASLRQQLTNSAMEQRLARYAEQQGRPISAPCARLFMPACPERPRSSIVSTQAHPDPYRQHWNQYSSNAQYCTQGFVYQPETGPSVYENSWGSHVSGAWDAVGGAGQPLPPLVSSEQVSTCTLTQSSTPMMAHASSSPHCPMQSEALLRGTASQTNLPLPDACTQLGVAFRAHSIVGYSRNAWRLALGDAFRPPQPQLLASASTSHAISSPHFAACQAPALPGPPHAASYPYIAPVHSLPSEPVAETASSSYRAPVQSEEHDIGANDTSEVAGTPCEVSPRPNSGVRRPSFTRQLKPIDSWSTPAIQRGSSTEVLLSQRTSSTSNSANTSGFDSGVSCYPEYSSTTMPPFGSYELLPDVPSPGSFLSRPETHKRHQTTKEASHPLEEMLNKHEFGMTAATKEEPPTQPSSAVPFRIISGQMSDDVSTVVGAILEQVDREFIQNDQRGLDSVGGMSEGLTTQHISPSRDPFFSRESFGSVSSSGYDSPLGSLREEMGVCFMEVLPPLRIETESTDLYDIYDDKNYEMFDFAHTHLPRFCQCSNSDRGVGQGGGSADSASRDGSFIVLPQRLGTDFNISVAGSDGECAAVSRDAADNHSAENDSPYFYDQTGIIYTSLRESERRQNETGVIHNILDSVSKDSTQAQDGSTVESHLSDALPLSPASSPSENVSATHWSTEALADVQSTEDKLAAVLSHSSALRHEILIDSLRQPSNNDSNLEFDMEEELDSENDQEMEERILAAAQKLERSVAEAEELISMAPSFLCQVDNSNTPFHSASASSKSLQSADEAAVRAKTETFLVDETTVEAKDETLASSSLDSVSTSTETDALPLDNTPMLIQEDSPPTSPPGKCLEQAKADFILSPTGASGRVSTFLSPSLIRALHVPNAYFPDKDEDDIIEMMERDSNESMSAERPTPKQFVGSLENSRSVDSILEVDEEHAGPSKEPVEQEESDKEEERENEAGRTELEQLESNVKELIPSYVRYFAEMRNDDDDDDEDEEGEKSDKNKKDSSIKKFVPTRVRKKRESSESDGPREDQPTALPELTSRRRSGPPLSLTGASRPLYRHSPNRKDAFQRPTKRFLNNWSDTTEESGSEVDSYYTLDVSPSMRPCVSDTMRKTKENDDQAVKLAADVVADVMAEVAARVVAKVRTAGDRDFHGTLASTAPDSSLAAKMETTSETQSYTESVSGSHEVTEPVASGSSCVEASTSEVHPLSLGTPVHMPSRCSSGEALAAQIVLDLCYNAVTVSEKLHEAAARLETLSEEAPAPPEPKGSRSACWSAVGLILDTGETDGGLARVSHDDLPAAVGASGSDPAFDAEEASEPEGEDDLAWMQEGATGAGAETGVPLTSTASLDHIYSHPPRPSDHESTSHSLPRRVDSARSRPSTATYARPGSITSRPSGSAVKRDGNAKKKKKGFANRVKKFFTSAFRTSKPRPPQ